MKGATVPEKPENPYAHAYEYFTKHIAEHQLHVEHEDGLYRTLLMTKPDTMSWHWRVTTTPGYLVSVGDVADGYVFSREPDMLAFMRVDEQDYYSDGAPCIDFHYWAGKLQGRSAKDVRAFSSTRLRQIVEQWAADSDAFGDEILEELKAATDSDVADELVALRQERDGFIAEASTIGSIEEFGAYASKNSGNGFVPEDWYEDSPTDWDTHFLYTCWAIERTTRAWDERPAPEDKGDDFILLDGGLVANAPALPVFDLDLFESDDPDGPHVEDYLDLTRRIAVHPTEHPALIKAFTYASLVVKALGDEAQLARLAADTEITKNHPEPSEGDTENA